MKSVTPRSRRQKVVAALVAVVGSSLLLTSCTSPSGGSPEESSAIADMEPVTLSLHLANNADHPQAVALQKLADEVSEKTDGKVTIELYLSNSLLTAPDDLPGIAGGVADMGQVFASYHTEALPTISWLASMQSLRSGVNPHGFLQASAALQRTFSMSEAIAEEAEAQNVVILGTSSSATDIGLLCTKPISTPEEAKGVNVRMGGGTVWTEEIKSMGFTPVVLGTSELYEGLQRGVVDCEWANPLTMASFKLWEVAKYYIPVAGSGTSSTLLAMNKDTYESLPAEVQAIIKAAAEVYSLESPVGGLEGYRGFAEQAEANGVTTIDPTALNEPLREHQARVLKELPNSAPASITDPEAFIQDWRDSLKWGMEIAVENVGSEPIENPSASEILESYIPGPDMVDMSKFIEAVRNGL